MGGQTFGRTRQMMLPTSSLTSNAPRLSMASMVGRPCAFSSLSRNPVSTFNGLPVGMQIVGPRYNDRLVLAASAAFEQACPWSYPD